jgi:hypothetical protein
MPYVLYDAVNQMDDDNEDAVSFDEFRHWVNGTPQRACATPRPKAPSQRALT